MEGGREGGREEGRKGGGREGGREGMTYSDNGLIVGHNNKKIQRASGEPVHIPV